MISGSTQDNLQMRKQMKICPRVKCAETDHAELKHSMISGGPQDNLQMRKQMKICPRVMCAGTDHAELNTA